MNPLPGPDAMGRLGLENWLPPGHFDERTRTWFVDRAVPNSFPETGVDLFRQTDDDSFWFDHRNTVIHDVLSRFAPRNALLEVGSGSGVVAAYLANKGWDVACVEPVASGAMAAASRGATASFCGDLASLKLPDRTVPAIGLFDVIEHIEQPLSLLEEVRRIVRPDGVVTVTVPAYQWLWSDFDLWNGHFRRYTLARLSHELEQAGLMMIHGTYLFAPLVPPAAVSRLAFQRKDRQDSDIEDETAAKLAPANPMVDKAIRAVLALEAKWLRQRTLPFGTSVMAVARPMGLYEVGR